MGAVKRTTDAVIGILMLSGLAVLAGDVERWVRDQTIKFVVPEDWLLVGQQPRAPKSVTAFQVPNPADVGTAESSNVMVSAFDTADADAMAAFDETSQKFREGRPVTKGDFVGWQVFRYTNNQKGIPYRIMDAQRTIGPCIVLVRFAWPQLHNNAPDYDSKMEMAFNDLLGSINEKNKLK
jgi:hypothetical protein